MATPFLDEIVEVGAGGIPTTDLWEEIRDNLGGGGGGGGIAGSQKGAITLGGNDGVTVTIEDMGSAAYDITHYISRNSNSIGKVGEVTFEILSATQFKVYNTGSDTESVLRYWVTPIDAAEARGTATMGGNSGVLVTMATNLGTDQYDVFYWLTRNPGTVGETGEITIEIMSGTQFVVYNSGSDIASTINYWAVTR